MKKGLIYLLTTGILTSSCATKRPFAENHLYKGIKIEQITQNDIPYKKLDVGIFKEEYNFKEADDNSNPLGFEIRKSKYTSDVFEYGNPIPTREAKDEFIPKKIKMNDLILTIYKEIPKHSKFDKSKGDIIYKKITTEKGQEFYIATISLENKTFAIAERENSTPGKLDFYFVDTENFKYSLEKPRIGNEKNVVVKQGDIYEWILEQSTPNKTITKNMIQTQQYKIKSGDTYWKIAEEIYGTGKDANKIMKLNNAKNTKLMVGQYINIPIKK